MATDLGICSNNCFLIFGTCHPFLFYSSKQVIYIWMAWYLGIHVQAIFFYIFCLGRVVSFECCFWYKESKCTIPRWGNVSCFIKDDFDVSQLINFWDIFLIINIWFELAVWEIISTLWPFSILGMYKLIHCQVNSMIFCFASIRQVKPFSTDC